MNVRLAMIGSWGDMQPLRALAPELRVLGNRAGAGHPKLWKEYEAEFNERFGAALNEERAKAHLGPVASVLPYMFTDRPWLAADPAAGLEVV